MQKNVARFVSKARHILTPLLDESGSVLYSACHTLRRGDIYFLGLNPGGSGGGTIAESLAALSRKKSNAYIDESWSNARGRFEPGCHPLQLSASGLFSALGVPIQRVCASNLIFTRSRGECGAGYPENAEICWPVHELVLSIVQPSTIITFGRQPFDFIAAKLKIDRDGDIPSGHGSWRCRAGRNPAKVCLVGLPHLSWFRPAGSKAVLDRVRASLDSRAHEHPAE